MFRKIGLVFFASLLFNCLYAKQVTEQDAKKAGLQFFAERASQYHAGKQLSPQVSGSYSITENGQVVYYIFNIQDKGYVIVSGENAVTPILGYSFEGSYSQETQAPQFIAWMKQYAQQIKFAREKNALPLPGITERWAYLINPLSSPYVPLKSKLDVEPMITSNWNQPSPYNGMCPADPAGSNGHAMSGCVPVAMAQIMYYYRWPDHGTGSYTYYDSTYGTQHATFDSTWYRWNNMKNIIADSDSGIAQLIYHLGVSVDLKYGAQSSGMFNHKAAYALRTYFKYSPQTQYVYRDSTNLSWDSIIIAHLNRKMPLYYAGWSVPNINGHAFVCDGYQGGDYFHFNFGWSGLDNGYYYVDNLTPGGNNFNLAQELIINIYPDTLHYTYPAYCTGETDLVYDQGSFSDGSGPLKNYQSGSNCSWLINPQTLTDSISQISLDFDTFDTGPGDIVTIYDGGTTSSPVLGTWSGTNLPPAITSTGNKLKITFSSTGSTPGTGWSANYTTTTPVYCSGTETITADTADITDGSLQFNYNNNSSCRWMLLPKSGKKPFTVYFKSFDTEPVKDVLRIFDPDSQNTLAVISGHYNSPELPDSVTSPSGKMYIIFTTSNTITGEGFHLYYPKSTLGVQENSIFSGIKIYPNPVHDLINVEFQSEKIANVEMTLTTLLGKNLLTQNTNCFQGKNLRSIPVTNIPRGVYLLCIQNESSTQTFKIVITNQ
jgi:hypothetical protein